MDKCQISAVHSRILYPEIISLRKDFKFRVWRKIIFLRTRWEIRPTSWVSICRMGGYQQYQQDDGLLGDIHFSEWKFAFGVCVCGAFRPSEGELTTVTLLLLVRCQFLLAALSTCWQSINYGLSGNGNSDITKRFTPHCHGLVFINAATLMPLYRTTRFVMRSPLAVSIRGGTDVYISINTYRL